MSFTDFPTFTSNPFVNNNSYKLQKNEDITILSKQLDMKSHIASDQDSNFVVFKKEKTTKDTFVKLYVDQLTSVLNLSLCGRKILAYIMQNIEFRHTDIDLGSYKVLKALGYKTRNQVYRGINELLKADVLARTIDHRTFYINPLFFFKGDDLYIVTHYTTKSEADLINNNLQQLSDNHSSIPDNTPDNYQESARSMAQFNPELTTTEPFSNED